MRLLTAGSVKTATMRIRAAHRGQALPARSRETVNRVWSAYRLRFLLLGDLRLFVGQAVVIRRGHRDSFE